MFLYPQMNPGVMNPLQSFHTLLRTAAPAGYPNTGWAQPNPWMLPYQGGVIGQNPYRRNYASPQRMQIMAPPWRGPTRWGWQGGGYGRPVSAGNQNFNQTHFNAPPWRGLKPFGFGMYANQMLTR